ncbi:unnamed protein product [Prunus armeniaca]|uniref:Uncharacterized protein n=1 Tax=Prunus armeniaca TaxID=36596 RepID=A0A6J5XV32_PRUAR|nr:unnamed protein product [Prunus armeniaca]CAB4317746.1 unnamed protein product [Prunus armeniaca]
MAERENESDVTGAPLHIDSSHLYIKSNCPSPHLLFHFFTSLILPPPPPPPLSLSGNEIE